MTNNHHQVKDLLKILIGAAWIDGTIQPEEREYLHKMAQDNNLLSDPEIQILFSEAKKVKTEECYQWLEDYLGNYPSQDEYQDLFAAISRLIYSDNLIEGEEAELINYLQGLDPSNEPSKSVFNKVLKNIQKFYRQAIN